MNRSTFFALSLAGALALASAPAFAQHHRGGGEERRDNAAPRTERRESQPQQQAAQPRQQEQRQEQRAEPRQERRQEQRAEPRQERRQEQRQEQRAEPRRDYREYRGQSREYRGQYSTPRYNYNAPRYSGRYYGSRYSGPRFSYSPRRFYRPYYVFRPRFSLGFGIWAGYPITYYDPYYYPYDYSYSTSPVGPSYSLPPQGSVGVQPGVQGSQANMGGLSFDITPDTAELYVDGQYFGDVGQYTSSSQPLGLAAGRHHIELREPGYEVSSFDVDIVPGQVIPYQGQLQK